MRRSAHKARPLKSELIRFIQTAAVLFLFSVSGAWGAEEQLISPVPPGIQAFRPGEILTYEVSWSKILSAGTAIMKVEEERLPDGREGLKFVVTGRTTGMVDRIFPVNDTVQSVFDPLLMQSLSYSLRESFGKKKRLRVMVFDHPNNTVVSKLNEDPAETLAAPDRVQDALSSLYYLRTMDDFIPGKTHVVNIIDSGKNWSVEVSTLGREKVVTPAGEFDTIKIKTYPKHQGVFMNKGEVFIWLTDDNRKIPVLLKSTLKVGSFVFTLTEARPGYGAR
jgi:hypothetical protein